MSGATAVVTTVTATPALAARPAFQMPFPCGQVWKASTYSGHPAIDWNRYPEDNGHTVVASAAGTASLYHEPLGGYQVIINHGDGWKTVYAHLQQAGRVSGSVTRGQTIGYVGNTGGVYPNGNVVTFSPHLHWEQVYNNVQQTTLYANGVALSPGPSANQTAPSYTSNNCETTPPPPTVPTRDLTASTEDAQYGGDFNGDSWGDAVIVHQRADGGADVHILYGNVGTHMFANSNTIARSLPASSGWDWAKMKLATGQFNDDDWDDLVILHQRADGGADVHILYGNVGTHMFANATTFVRSLPASSGWDWAKMKVVSGDVNGDSWDDLVIAHQVADGGAGIHVFYGNVGTHMFANATTSVRQLAGSNGWDWAKMKLAVGPFNGDRKADLAVFHQRSDGGINIHILNGGGTPFTNSDASSYLRGLTSADGWDWTKVKLTAGPFNNDGFADVALLHQMGDGGIGVHVVYGDSVPFAYPSTAVRSLLNSAGWDWTKVKLTAGLFNDDSWGDAVIVHQRADGGADAHILYGNVGTHMFANSTTIARTLPASAGWDWGQMKFTG